MLLKIVDGALVQLRLRMATLTVIVDMGRWCTV